MWGAIAALRKVSRMAASSRPLPGMLTRFKMVENARMQNARRIPERDTRDRCLKLNLEVMWLIIGKKTVDGGFKRLHNFY